MITLNKAQIQWLCYESSVNVSLVSAFAGQANDWTEDAAEATDPIEKAECLEMADQLRHRGEVLLAYGNFLDGIITGK